MRFTDIISDVNSVAALGTTQINVIKRAVRSTLERYAAAYPWPHYREIGTLQTLATYTTGTVDVTNGSKTVSGNSTVFTSAMVGRKFRVGTERAWYDIETFTSTTSIALKQAYQGSTQTAVTYTIFQDEYRLASDVHQLLNVRQTQFGLLMVGLSYHDLDTLVPAPVSLTEPFYWSFVGRRDDRYTTGTVTGSVSGTTITGTTTAWTDVLGLTKGSRIAVTSNSEVYTVKSVDSGTQLTVYEPIAAAFTTSNYLIYLNNIRLQLTDIPASMRNLYYRYIRVPYPLVNDYDEPDMPREHHYMLVWGGLSIAQALKGNVASSQDAETRLINSINDQIKEFSSTSPTESFLKRSMDIAIGMPLAIRYPSQYGFPVWVPSP